MRRLTYIFLVSLVLIGCERPEPESTEPTLLGIWYVDEIAYSEDGSGKKDASFYGYYFTFTENEVYMQHKYSSNIRYDTLPYKLEMLEDSTLQLTIGEPVEPAAGSVYSTPYTIKRFERDSMEWHNMTWGCYTTNPNTYLFLSRRKIIE